VTAPTSMHLPVLVERLERASRQPPRARVLFVTDNGHGLGHVSRMMAIARRLPLDVEPRFVTLSSAYPVIERAGFEVVYIPSRRAAGGSWAEWSDMAKRQLLDVLDEGYDALVLDHVRPWKFLRQVKRQHRHLVMTWSRRGLWKPQRNEKVLQLERLFDSILEPMDLASVHDRGGTTTLGGAVRVPPVTLLDRDEMLERGAARRALGLPDEGPCVLVQLSADSPDQLGRLVDSARELVARTDPAASLLVPIHPLHPNVADGVDGVTIAPRFPMARYFAAFDYAISTAGYNTFHELVTAAVPTLFVARETDSLDNQALRASTAPLVGFGCETTALADSGDTMRALTELADPHRRRRMRAAAGELLPQNGADGAASLVAGALRDRQDARPGSPA